MQSLRNRPSTAFVWALVPFMVVNGVPRISCICADGQHKLFCSRQLTKECCRDGQAGSKSCPCCCKSDVAKRSDRDLDGNCRGQVAKDSTCATVSKAGCTRYLVSPVVPTVAKTVAAPQPIPEWTLLEIVPNLGMILAAGPARESVRNPDLPVPDLVIAHQVFTI